MDNAEVKALNRWLHEASSQELETKLLNLEHISNRLTEPGVIREFKWIQKKILEEIDAREEVASVSRKLLENKKGDRD